MAAAALSIFNCGRVSRFWYLQQRFRDCIADHQQHFCRAYLYPDLFDCEKMLWTKNRVLVRVDVGHFAICNGMGDALGVGNERFHMLAGTNFLAHTSR